MEEEVFLNGTDDALFGGDFNESLCSVNATAAAVEGLNCSKFVVAAKCVMSVIPMVSILPSLLSISLLAQWPPKFRNHKPHWVNGLVFGMSHTRSHMTMTMCVRIMVPARFLVRFYQKTVEPLAVCTPLTTTYKVHPNSKQKLHSAKCRPKTQWRRLLTLPPLSPPSVVFMIQCSSCA